VSGIRRAVSRFTLAVVHGANSRAKVQNVREDSSVVNLPSPPQVWFGLAAAFDTNYATNEQVKRPVERMRQVPPREQASASGRATKHGFSAWRPTGGRRSGSRLKSAVTNQR